MKTKCLDIQILGKLLPITSTEWYIIMSDINEFLLQTDLDGIKWRKLTAENTCFTDPLEDPVLQSFTRCIKSDVLCVWRRVQSSGSSEQKVTDQLSNGKELWIFWYGDEPHNLSNLLSHELQGTYTSSASRRLQCRKNETHVYNMFTLKMVVSEYTFKLLFITTTNVKLRNGASLSQC